MRSMRILGLALVAAFAVAAFAASAASANPSWYYCQKQAKNLEKKYEGKYNDKLCSEESGTHEGKYELVEGIGKGKGFKGKGGLAILHTVAPGHGDLKVECQSFKDSGSVADLGGKGLELNVKSEFKKCTSLGGASCKTEEGKKGTITTETLAGNLGWLNKEAGVAGTSLANQAEPGAGLLAHFECEGLAKVRVHGAVIGVITPVGKVSKESTTTFSVGHYLAEDPEGLVNPPAFEEEVVGVLLTEINGPETGNEWTEPIPSGQEASALNKGESLEIK